MDVIGIIEEIKDTQQVSEKFRKREIIIKYATNPQYPELVKFEFVQDKCDILDGYKAGQEVQLYFDLRGRKWTDAQGVNKYFTTLQGWRIQPTAQQAPAPQQPPQAQPGRFDAVDVDAGTKQEGVDEIPF